MLAEAPPGRAMTTDSDRGEREPEHAAAASAAVVPTRPSVDVSGLFAPSELLLAAARQRERQRSDDAGDVEDGGAVGALRGVRARVPLRAKSPAAAHPSRPVDDRGLTVRDVVSSSSSSSSSAVGGSRASGRGTARSTGMLGGSAGAAASADLLAREVEGLLSQLQAPPGRSGATGRPETSPRRIASAHEIAAAEALDPRNIGNELLAGLRPLLDTPVRVTGKAPPAALPDLRSALRSGVLASPGGSPSSSQPAEVDDTARAAIARIRAEAARVAAEEGLTAALSEHSGVRASGVRRP